MTASGPILVAGAGILGASIAYHLAKRGARVTILEKESPGSGATANSFAWLNAGDKRPRPYYELNLLGIAGWRRLQAEIGAALPIQWGGAVEWAAPGAGAERLLEAIRGKQDYGYATRRIGDAELRRLLPTVAPGAIGIACHNEMEGTLDPMQALDALLEKAKEFGATVEFPCQVTGFHFANGFVKGVTTTHGPREAAAVVLAAGLGIPDIATAAGLPVPLIESAGTLAHSVPQAPLLERVVLAPRATIKQNPDGRIVTGLDYNGTPHAATSGLTGAHLLENARAFLTQLNGMALASVTTGYRVLPSDGYPIVGLSGRYSNLYVAAMHSGITLAPIVGELAALEILDRVRSPLLGPYRPSRFV